MTVLSLPAGSAFSWAVYNGHEIRLSQRPKWGHKPGICLGYSSHHMWFSPYFLGIKKEVDGFLTWTHFGGFLISRHLVLSKTSTETFGSYPKVLVTGPCPNHSGRYLVNIDPCTSPHLPLWTRLLRQEELLLAIQSQHSYLTNRTW